MQPEPHELREFAAMVRAVDGQVNTKVKRQIYSQIREGASMDTLAARLGLTYAQIALGLTLRDKAS